MILDTRVTYFRTTTDTEVGGTYSIRQVLEAIKAGNYKDEIAKVRAGDDFAKRNLPTVAMHGLFEFARKKKDFFEASGIIILDIDDLPLDEVEPTKEEIMQYEDKHVLAALTSPSGNGIKVLYYVDPELVTADNYSQIGKQLINSFDSYGNVDYLSVTDCLIMSYDPNILINENAEPAFVYIKPPTLEKVKEIEPLDKDRELWENPEDFFDTVLAHDIEQKTNNNFHFIQISLLDLKKFGFEHPKYDLSFVIDYSENVFKSSSDNKKRFIEMVEVAKSYPQLYWPYKMISSDDDDDEYIDYADMIDPDAVKKVSSKKEKKEDSEEDDSVEPNIIDYENLFERVVARIKEGPRVGFETSFSNFNEIFRFRGTGILTVTGIPGHGKTEFVDAVTLDLARLHGHCTLVVGFEQTPEEHIIKYLKKLIGADITCPTWHKDSKNQERLKIAYEYIIKHFTHIDVNKTGGNINEILKSAALKIKQLRAQGRVVKYITLDPFNMLSIKGRFSNLEKVEEILRRIIHFSHQMDVMAILVAHPFKMKKDEKTGQYEIPDFYSVKGSSAFFEMSYHGLVVYRRGGSNGVLVRVLKVKQSNLGQKDGEAEFSFDRLPGRYIPVDEEGSEESGDHRETDWLEKALTNINN